MTLASLTLREVEKVYGAGSRHRVTAVKRLSMSIEDGEIVGLLGSSGCGKTSTLRMIAGLESITAGEARIGHRLINGLRAADRNVAMAFEGYALYPPLRVRDNIAFSLLRDKAPKSEVAEKVGRVAQLLEIADLLERYPAKLASGQQQRVSLARALVRSADVHLLDEPMSQLEPELRAILRARLKDYLIQNGLTTVFVTHDQTEAIALADRIAVMEDGELQQFDSPDSLRERPSNLFVATFIGEPPMNVFAANVAVQDDVVRLRVGPLGVKNTFNLDLPKTWLGDDALRALVDGNDIYVGIRPHQLRIGESDPNRAQVSLQGTVVSNQWLGDQTHIGLEVAGTLLIAVSDGDIDAPMDTRQSLQLPLDRLHVFDGSTRRALLHGAGK